MTEHDNLHGNEQIRVEQQIELYEGYDKIPTNSRTRLVP